MASILDSYLGLGPLRANKTQVEKRVVHDWFVSNSLRSNPTALRDSRNAMFGCAFSESGLSFSPQRFYDLLGSVEFRSFF